MKRNVLISVLILCTTAALAVISFFILPENVITQLSFGSSQPTTMPKLFAILIPVAFGVGGCVTSLVNSDKEKTVSKSFWISLIGIALFIIMLVVNLSIH